LIGIVTSFNPNRFPRADAEFTRGMFYCYYSCGCSSSGHQKVALV